MKTSKSPENAEVTPSKKKLKQARLPFKLLGEVSPKPVTPQTRKRKFSASEVDPAPKLGKICKENDLIDHPVVIIDDDNEDAIKVTKDIKLPNPYVKLVDAARKKKLQKTKKKKNDKKSHKATNPVLLNDDKETEIELMDVDENPEIDENVSQDNTNTEKKSNQIKEILNDEQNTKHKNEDIKTNNISEVITVEDSNNSEDITKYVENNKTSKNDENITGESEETEDSPDTDSTPSKTKNTKSKDTENCVTPKRSMRNRTKAEQSNNSKSSNSTLNESFLSKSSTNSKHNDSISSVTSTPKNSKNTSITNSLGDVSLNESTASINLTPKQAQKKLELVKKKEEREKKKQQEKEEKAKLKQEKEDQKKREREEKEEAKKREKEEKEEQKRKEKEEKDKQRELEKKQREEKEEQKRKEKEEKDEQKRKEKEAKEEEKRKKQEALELEKQEQELKKKKAAEAFVNFFVPKQKSEKDQATIGSINNNMLSNFTLKGDMRLAPLVRVNFSEDQKHHLDNLLIKQEENVLYLKSLKNGVSKPLTTGKTWPLSDKDDDDVMIVEDAELPPMDGAAEILSSECPSYEKLRPKLLSFHENRRPPYWGTWRKNSTSIKPRKPFGQDQKQLDYEVDSDEEWEEEQEGESLDGSAAGSDDEQDGDEYEVDNVVFVPHGYLSDEEATMDEDDVLSLSPETQQARLKHLEDEFESEMKKPTEKLKPRMYGLLWETADGGKPDNCVDTLWNYFKKMAMIMDDPTPFLQPSKEPEEVEKKKVKKKKQVVQTEGEQKEKSPKRDKKKKSKPDNKESNTPKSEAKNNPTDVKKGQPGINMFLTKTKSS